MFLIVRSFPLTNSGTRSHFGFNYDKNGRDWNIKGGKRQSPIALCKYNATTSHVPKLELINYHKLLCDPLSVINVGLTVLMRIPKTVEGEQPSVCISTEVGHIFEAQQLHFHWGSEQSRGSEHNLDGEFYDGEMHIVHKNATYETNNEAGRHPNGFAVLAIMLRNLKPPENESLALNEIFNQVSEISEVESTQNLGKSIALEDLFGGMDTGRYLTYQGSLTTPPCAEAVLWFVFQTPLDIPHELWQNFWQLRNSQGQRVLNTYRVLQDDHDRTVYLSEGKSTSQGTEI
ncbi:uncharacterized protein Dana_GF18008, isoform A [Drosophila ananassae]|uniref:Carbonic anhydrase n=2 Tax=Drosophila ananassae TaxID=7217 RepID=B3LV08_DROAN|nr:carbonic anhydrase 2 isoform X1 [Drosophila ananassae]EDV42480.1 uncharacterized protein Dana_GF18008, isoform A [Drosophila ananassae]